MNLNLFFSDGTKEYRNPVDVKAGDDVTVRFRVPAGCHAYPMLHIKQGEFPMILERSCTTRAGMWVEIIVCNYGAQTRARGLC